MPIAWATQRNIASVKLGRWVGWGAVGASPGAGSGSPSCWPCSAAAPAADGWSPLRSRSSVMLER